MADEVKVQGAPAEAAAEKVKKKKTRPTNCVQSGKRIRRKDWYYRDGNYFANKAAHKLWKTQQEEKARKAQEEAATKAA